MSLAEIKKAVERLPAREQKYLAAHLLAWSRRADRGFRRRLARKIDDRNPAHWVSLQKAEKQLG